ncbi:DsbA family protein [Shewanella youngdeokensis]|uniref:DsbA family protein n=1 Tax=Shewanella youngdeokensis TaxID=2999068 RepID=A0ABZ0JZ16_9GAMM|nr:DsbA family protein [Shewanella sp. DAU334]
MNVATLFYIYDPMCSWCWGYNRTWSLLKAQLKKQFSQLNIEYRLGGLAADTQEPMPKEMQLTLQQIWHRIEAELGAQFNFDFWSQCQPRRATYPASRALILARDQALEVPYYLAVQQAYYLQAKNPSDDATLIDIAIKLGMDGDAFSHALNSEATQNRLLQEFAQTRRLPMQGFPSLVMALNGELIAIELDYLQAQTSFNQIAALMESGSTR